MVRCVALDGQATGWPSCSESRASAASAGSTPMMAASGRSARTAAATPEISPPPPTGTTTRSTPGLSAAISRPTVPWPAITRRSSNGGMDTAPRCAARSRVAASRAARLGAEMTISAPSARMAATLTGAASSGTTTIEGMPSSAAAYATARPWLPLECVITPRSRAAAGSVFMAA